MAALPQLPAVQETSDDASKDAVFENILETLQENNSLLDEIEDNTESDESVSEKRNRRVKEENTDKPGAFSKAIGGLGAGVKGVGGILNKANPFQEGGLGPKMSILLLSGVLFAISKFGDKLIKPLAEVLEAFDSEGGVLEKLKNTDLFKGVVATFEKIGADIKKQFETIGTDIQTAFDDSTATFKQMGETIKTMGDDIGKLLESVTLVGGYVKSAYDTIMGYINQFDTSGAGPRNMSPDGKLDSFEMKNLRNDLEKKVFDFIGDLVTNIFSVMGTIFGVGLLYQFAKGRMYRLGLGDKPSADGPNKRSSRSSILKKIAARTASAFTIGGSATASSVGGTSAAANLAKDMRLNSANRVIYTKTGQYVAGYGLSHLAKYPGLIKIAKRAPFLAPILGGVQAIKLFSDPNATHDDKAVGLGRIFGEVGGAALFAKIGGALGTMALPGWGTALGAITGALGGYFAGGHIGEELARFMLGDKPLMGEFGNSNLGSTLNTSTGTVENLPIQTMSGTSGYETNAGVNDQYYDGEVPNLSILTSSGEYPQESLVSQLDSSLMNRNSDLAIAAYQANLQSKSALEFDQRLGQKQRDAKGADVVVMPQIIDQSEIKTFNSNYSSSLGSSNLFSTVRVLNLDGVNF